MQQVEIKERGMRLIEIKKKLDTLVKDGQITIQTDQRFGGYAQTILDSPALFTVLKFLSEQGWNDTDFNQIDAIIQKYNALSANEITVDQNEINEIQAYTKVMNQKIPVLMSLIEYLAEEQTEHDFSIKLSSEIKTPEQLEKLTKEIIQLEKFSNVDGGTLQFKGFDKGSDWIIVTAAPLTYAFIMACLKLAQQYLVTKEQYFKTEQAKLAYLATLVSSDADFSDKGFKQFQSDYSKAQLQNGAKDIAKSISEANGHAGNELETKAGKTTQSLINIIGDGNEVHLSLNPPKEISESAEGLVDVDYSYLTDLAKKKSETKQVSANNSPADAAVVDG